MLFSLVALLAAAQSFAFTILPPAGADDARWRKLPVQFRVNYEFSPYAPDQLNALINDAFSLWNGVSTSELRLEIGPATTARAEDFITGTSDETVIVFDPNFSANIGADNSVLAVGTAISVGDEFVQGVVLINAFARGVGTDQERLRVILAHEIGHAVGLGHTNDEAALMFPFAQRISQLGEDDVSGITYLYPRKEVIDGAPFGCGTLAASASGGDRMPPSAGLVTLAGWLGLFAALWAGIRRAPKGAR